MAQVKPSLSHPAELFDAAEFLAQERVLTRSPLDDQALEELIERHRSQKLLDGFDAASGEPSDPEDAVLVRGIQCTIRRVGDPGD